MRWERKVEVELARAGLDDPALVDLMAGADKVGIDVPLGWPHLFVTEVAGYSAGGGWEVLHSDPDLRLRATDRHVARFRGRHPLSVSTDRIALPAMRAARLLTQVDAGFDRSGGGKVVEVYPAASLKAWGFDPDGYKRARGRTARERLVDRFVESTSAWVRLDAACKDSCLADDNVFDALLCALTARAAALGLCEAVPPEHREAARTEGWIALPAAGSLAKLSP